MKKYIIIIFALLTTKCFSQLNIVPLPAEMKRGKGNFALDRNTVIYYTANSVKKICFQFNNSIKNKYGFTLPIKYLSLEQVEKLKNKNITFLLFPKLVKKDSISGTYTITINQNNINITAMEEEGLLYGLQTLTQLLPDKKQPSNSGDMGYFDSVGTLFSSLPSFACFSLRLRAFAVPG